MAAVLFSLHRAATVTVFGRPQYTPHPRRPHNYSLNDGDGWYCPCGKRRDDAAIRRGKQSRNYGNRAELAASRQYGGRKVGHAQGPTDVVGVNTKTQVKTRRGFAPAMWRTEFAKLDIEQDGRLPRLLLRFVRPGNLGPDDYFVVRGSDWIDWFGRDE